MDHKERCINCFAEQKTNNTCSACDYVDSAAETALLLAPRTILAGKYLIGRPLGQGGFGITYLAWDLTLDLKLAIKEFFPLGLAARSAGQLKIEVPSGELSDQYRFGLDRYLEEAKTLARFSEQPNIVTVRDFFQANNTAYMVMNYIEGLTLEAYLKQSGGKIAFNKTLEIMMPVMDALREVHRAGFMHRDISPDNIFINQDGRVVLIDFGAARQEMREKSKSLSVILKAGYAPEEQYRSRGKQGSWTDIYAVAATMYRAITGKAPLEAIDRMAEDDLITPSDLGVIIEPDVEKVLLKALAVKAKDRYQTVEEFQVAVLQEANQSMKSQSKIAVDSSTGEQDQHFMPETKRGEDIEKEILLSRLEADLGAERSIIIDLDSICLECNGTGLKNGSICSPCTGKGKQPKQETVSVLIPAGAKEGTKVRLQGQGNKGVNGGANGDLFLVVKLEEYKKDNVSYSLQSQKDKREVAREKWKKRMDSVQAAPKAFWKQASADYNVPNIDPAVIAGLTKDNVSYSRQSQKYKREVVREKWKKRMDSVQAAPKAFWKQASADYNVPIIDPAVIAGLTADYQINYMRGNISLNKLPIGARVVDPSWAWEFRKGESYSREVGDQTKPVTWIVVAKDHYKGMQPHVTLIPTNLIGKYHFFEENFLWYIRPIIGIGKYRTNHWGDNTTHGLRAWLNSTGTHANEGLFQAFSESFKNAVITTTVPNKEWRNGSAYSTYDKVFIPSTTELGVTNDSSYPIGSVYPFFQGTDAVIQIARFGGKDWWWTRTPCSNWNSIVVVGPSYELYHGLESKTAVFPVVNLKADTLVSKIRN
jgi:serine/threonine protein kinase